MLVKGATGISISRTTCMLQVWEKNMITPPGFAAGIGFTIMTSHCPVCDVISCLIGQLYDMTSGVYAAPRDYMTNHNKCRKYARYATMCCRMGAHWSSFQWLAKAIENYDAIDMTAAEMLLRLENFRRQNTGKCRDTLSLSLLTSQFLTHI